MQLKTLLNKCHPLKSFVYVDERFEEIGGKECLVVDIVPRKNGKALCSICHKPCSTYDHQPTPRYFEFIPVWGILIYFCYIMRRVNCARCGIKVEVVPWCEGKHQLTIAYQIFLAGWAKKLSWKEVADAFHTSWGKVFRSIQYVVEYGLKNRVLDGITAIGVDEIQIGKGHQYVTVVYQLDQQCKRLLYISQKRTVKSFLGFFRMLGTVRASSIQYVCSDMWKPYLKVINKKLPQALHILDRFHIVANLNKALDEVRRAEAKSMKSCGYENVLNKSKYCFLKKPENLTEKQRVTLNTILQYDLKSVRAYLLKESFQLFWSYTSPYWAQRYLHLWCKRAMRSRLEPVKKFVRSLRRHEPLIMNWFKAKKVYSSGTVEGLNRKINLVTRKSYGFKNYKVLEVALFHALGNLPEPETTHRFW
jgi:transposase